MNLHDWDFSEESDLYNCWVYEFSREVALHSEPANPEWISMSTPLPSDDQLKVIRIPDVTEAYVVGKEFPTTSFQDLPEETRVAYNGWDAIQPEQGNPLIDFNPIQIHKLIQPDEPSKAGNQHPRAAELKLPSPVLEAMLGQLRRAELAQLGDEWQHLDGLWYKGIDEDGKADLVVFKIDWDYPDDTLIEFFRSWVKGNRWGRKEKSMIGRNTSKDDLLRDLNGLGALRLIRHFGSPVKAKEFIKKGGHKSPYGAAKSFYDGRSYAFQTLEEKFGCPRSRLNLKKASRQKKRPRHTRS